MSPPPVIDGVIGAEEWAKAPSVSGLFDAMTGAPYRDGGTFWLGYDDKYIYLAAKLDDSRPREIRANEYQTNVGLANDDYVELDIDLSGSIVDTNSFQINPRGATNIQLAGGRAAKQEWSGAFVAKARITAGGWEAEARIPWQMMSLPAKGKRDLRVNFHRFVARTQRNLVQTFTGAGQTGQTPYWSGVEMPSPLLDRSIKLLPYFYGGLDPKSGIIANSGLDLKTALSETSTLVGSINPDFRNIENNILSLDFSRFERLAGETRPFFQEGRNYFNSALFASQRIADFDVGLSSYGKITNKLSYGMLDTIDFGNQNSFVANATGDPDPSTEYRVSAVSLGTPGLHNDSYLLRGTKIFGPVEVDLRDLGSKDTELGEGSYRDAFIQYTKNGVQAFGGYTQGSPNFDPRLGFFPEVDIRGWTYGGSIDRNFTHGTFSESGANLMRTVYQHADGEPYRTDLNTVGQVTFRKGLVIAGVADWDTFEGSKDHLYTAVLGYPASDRSRSVTLEQDIGRQAGQDYQNTTLTCAYRPSKPVQLNLREQLVSFGGVSEQTILSGTYDLGRERSVAGRLVRQNGNTNFYLAYRRSGNLGTEYFLILGDPNAATFRSSLILKVAVPIELGGRSRSDRQSRSQ